MRAYVFVALLLRIASGEDMSRDYAATDVKRVVDVLSRLGVISMSTTKPYEAAPVNVSDPVVSSDAGDFEGYWTTSRLGRPIAAFEGIPYARPPVGPLRFTVAQPHPRISNLKAKKPGSPCIHRDGYLRNRLVHGSEDCLFINVYVPKKIQRAEPERLPVIFFIHGGGYANGRGDIYRSNTLLDQDVVLVTFNYRLGPLGFLGSGDGVIPANLGLKDQLAALRWVHENIGAFGGNPNLVTVHGHSAGSASAELLMLSPLTTGLFKRVIQMSGSALAPWAMMTSPEEMRHKVRDAAQRIQCPVKPSQDLLACLRNKTAEEVVLIDFHFPRWGKTPVVSFRPVVEGDIPGALVPRHPKDLYREGLNDVPILLSVTSQEGAAFTFDLFRNETLLREMDENFLEIIPQALYLSLPDQRRTKTVESLRRAYFSPGNLTKSNFFQGTNLYTDVYFLWPVTKSALLHRKHAMSPTYFYYIAHDGSQSKLKAQPNCSRKNLGVSHGDDLFYLFNMPSQEKPNPQDIFLSLIMTNLISSFARDGVPSSKLLEEIWLPITTNGTDFEYLYIKSPLEISMEKNFLPERRQLIEKLLWVD